MKVSEVEFFGSLIRHFLDVDLPEFVDAIFQFQICIVATTSVMRTVECPEDVVQRPAGQVTSLLAALECSGTSAWLGQIQICPAFLSEC